MASKRNIRRKEEAKMCGSKKRFDNKDDAGIALYITKRKFGDFTLSIYHCKFCGGWHIGHLPKKVLAIIEARRTA